MFIDSYALYICFLSISTPRVSRAFGLSSVSLRIWTEMMKTWLFQHPRLKAARGCLIGRKSLPQSAHCAAHLSHMTVAAASPSSLLHILFTSTLKFLSLLVRANSVEALTSPVAKISPKADRKETKDDLLSRAVESNPESPPLRPLNAPLNKP